jgi:hypothetical protein
MQSKSLPHIEDKAGIGRDVILRIWEEAHPAGSGVVLTGADTLFGDNQAECVSRKLIDDAVTHGPATIKLLRKLDWTWGIAVSTRRSAEATKYPAYFVYLLAHEMAHGHIIASDLATHAFCALIEWYLPRLRPNYCLRHELPQEVGCDSFGVHVAVAVHGREQLDREIREKVKADPGGPDATRLRYLLTLTPSRDLSNLVSATTNFLGPYWPRLAGILRERRERLGRQGLASLFDYVPEEWLARPAA